MTDSHRPGVGDTLDERYRLVELVGTGGMAHVYRADDLALGRVVAVKVMHAHAEEQSGPERLRAEVSLLASVGGHSLVTLYDARVTGTGTGTGTGPAYLVMEFVTGPTLSERIAEGPLPVAELDALAADLAEALHIVHAAGIVHRDVKPSNVLLARTPVPSRPYRAKLADFGIAHLLDATRVTSPGLTVGTAAYIAPELLDGADPAPPSDIYALGLVLIEAATGRRAFGMTDPRAQMLARLTSDPFVPASLGAHRRELFTRMASRTPADRPDAAELLTLLAAIPAGAPDLDEATAPVTILPMGATAAWGATAAMAPPASTPTMADADDPTRTMVLPPAIPAAAAAAAAASSPVAAPAATGRRRRARRVGVWVASAAAAALLVTGAWSLAAGVSPTAEPTPSTTPTVEVPAAPASEPPAPETVVVDQPTDDGASTDEGDGTSGNGNSGSNNSGNSGSGNGNSGNSDNGNGNGKGNGRGNG
ncbi:serine/threonine protein kinase [Microbacterium sp. W1N]|uniref:serine/threonine-protein kinase n=1 Tax=Microbacterium festucae TaxID=2977531 RepID=UPI0021C0F63A|nr:serine/threonine-protein kinase [Microbacterium festucae]MCT9821015.1 serine/threonine protein kinase [Microbacterium festucae]